MQVVLVHREWGYHFVAGAPANSAPLNNRTGKHSILIFVLRNQSRLIKNNHLVQIQEREVCILEEHTAACALKENPGIR